MNWAERIYESLPERFRQKREGRIRRYAIGTEVEMKQEIREQVVGEVRMVVVLLLLLLFCVIGTIWYSGMQRKTIEIERNAAGDGETTERVEIQVEGETYTYELPVSEEIYTKEEEKQAFKDAFSYLEKEMLGENVSLNQVRSDLTFLWEIPDSPMEVRWEFEDENMVDMEGKVYNENLEKNNIITHVKAILTYQGSVEEKVYTIIICPKKRTKNEQKAWGIWERIQNIEKNSRTSHFFQLPSALSKVKVQIEGRRNPWMLLLIFLILLIPLLVARQWEYEKKQMEEMRHASELEYSNILWQFILLLEAGFTIRSAWKKIVQDYEKQKADMQKSRRYVYEQMAYAYHRMELGEPQEKVFDIFSRKMAMKSYSKLMTLFLQNLTKGSKNMLDILKTEEQIAFANRCEQAKRMGEEADTKLLLPMGVMLLNILLLLMVPAFMQF
ncbi:MAG: hypothetical protein ACI4E3_12470 [Candidatus Fimousia sp.]